MLSTDEGYQRRIEPFAGNFTANIAASKLADIERAINDNNGTQDRSERKKFRAYHFLEWPLILFIRTFCNVVSDETSLEFFNHRSPHRCRLISNYCCYRAVTGTNSSRFR
jgi:hypothetical protein